jgi:hypothetical protein
MGHSSAIFYAAEQERFAILEQNRAGIEDTVDWIRPVFSGQDRIAAISREEGLIRTPW